MAGREQRHNPAAQSPPNSKVVTLGSEIEALRVGISHEICGLSGGKYNWVREHAKKNVTHFSMFLPHVHRTLSHFVIQICNDLCTLTLEKSASQSIPQ